MITDAKRLLQDAHASKSAIGAFNVSSIEAIQAVFLAADEAKSPVIIETSQGESEYLLPEMLVKTCESAAKLFNVEYVLHLDRGKDLDWIKRCLDAGYNSVASEFGDKTYDANVISTLKVRELTNRYNAQHEGALEIVPLRYYMDKWQKEHVYTSPEMAKQFVEQTKIDSFVVSIGTQSGKYKQKNGIDFELLQKINKLLPEMPFVLHGGSFLTVQDYRKCIGSGVAKINVNSELRLAYTKKLKENLHLKPDEYAPYRLLEGVVPAMQEIVTSKINIFKNRS